MEQIQINNEKYSKKQGPNSKRAYWVELTSKMLNKPFMQILGITRSWKQEWIEEMYLICSKAEEPSRLWWGLRKKNKV